MKHSIILIFALLFFVPNESFSQDWQLEKDKNGIKVFSRNIENYDFAETKTIMLLDIPKEDILKFIWNVENYPNWQKEFKKAKVVKTHSHHHKIIHFMFNTPWPIAERDVVIKMKQEQKDDTDVIYMKAIKDIVKPIDKQIRMSKYDGYWKIKEVNSKIELTCQILSNPEGKIPAFLVAFYKVTGPYNYFVNLRNELVK